MCVVAAAKEALVHVLIFLVHGLLEVYGRETEAGEEGEDFVSLGGRLTEALVCYDGCRRTCEVRYRHNSLSYCVYACLLGVEDVLGGEFVFVELVAHGRGCGRGWLGVWDLVVFHASKASSSVWTMLLFRS